jgi:tRNA A-37 threonylcarbamoyl transferase component Bud32
MGTQAESEGVRADSPAGPPAQVVASPSSRRSADLAKDAATKLRVGDFRGAAETASKAVSADPGNAQALAVRAAALNGLGRYEEALESAGGALRTAGASPSLLLTRALALNRLRRFSPALEDCAAALEIDPRNAYAHGLRAYAEEGLGRRSESRASLERAAALNPAFAELRQAALQVPQDADALLLFEDDSMISGAARRAPARGIPGWMLPLFSAAGALLTIAALFLARRRRPAAASARAPEGDIPTGYSVSRLIGAGGMGEVFEGRDLALDRRVAIKRMRGEMCRNPKERERFMAEARLVAKLKHPNIVEIYSVIDDGDQAYLVFEYVAGRTLARIIGEKERLPFEYSRSILRSICEAVDYAHRQGVVHRDLKPSNVMIGDDGAVKVMDFGIARPALEAQGRLTAAGTPPYMAPEAAGGAAPKESDVFSLGVCLYEMLSGSRPFAGTPAGMALAKSEGRYAPLRERLPGAPAELEACLAKALEADPARRFPGAGDFSAALSAVPGGWDESPASSGAAAV